MVIELGVVISKILSIGATLGATIGSKKILRNELVIKALVELGLNPEHPPADFTAVYQYTLVSYGIDKSQSAIEIFRQSEIQHIFRGALDQNDPTVLFKEGTDFLENHPLRNELEDLGIDPRVEFYTFGAIFIEVAKQTRTPAEVLTNQQIESLHQKISVLQDRLDRLPTMEGTRTEIARLFNPEALNLQLLSSPQFNTVKQQSFALSQQMRGWFETLKYEFEKYEVWEENYFEWIINIPTRRKRYDRVLVRGIQGEASLQDVFGLKKAFLDQKTDEAWLITARRISPAAREEVEKIENKYLECYTFDEMVDMDADFSRYVNWLQEEIQRRGIDKKYVPLACTKEEFNPLTKKRMTPSLYDEQHGWIDGCINRWLDDSNKEHISVLGEFGTGKTWFTLHYASVALKRYQEAVKQGTQRPRLPLVIPLRDYAKAVSVESLFSEFFFRKHEIPISGYSAFEQLNRMGKLLLIFDGFDEMAARIDRQLMIDNFWQLAKAIVPGAKVILTCRTEHFPKAQEGHDLFTSKLQSSNISLTGENPQFEVIELAKFNEDQIRQVLSLQTNQQTVEQVMSNPKLLELSSRPVMTELVLEALPDIEAGKSIDMSRIYLYAVQHKMKRDIKAERTFTSLADKLYFLCELSWEMLSTDRMSINYQDFPERIRRLFGSAVQQQKDLDHWRYDMMGQTMLIRNSDGDYAPAHRSLIEFFVAYKFAAELGALHKDFLGIAKEQNNINYSLEGKVCTWSDFFHQKSNSPNSPLKEFGSESFNELKKTFGFQPISQAVLGLMQKMIEVDKIWAILDMDELRNTEDDNYIGGNILTLLNTLNESFISKKLSGLNLRNARFNNIDLNGADFSSSNLANVDFHNVSLESVDFSSSDLSGVLFEEDSSVLIEFLSKELDFFIAIKNGWVYKIPFHNNENVSKIAFIGRGFWHIILVKNKGLMLCQNNTNSLGLWEFTSSEFTWMEEFRGSPIQAFSYSKEMNILLILRANNDLESWDFNSLELLSKMSLGRHVNGFINFKNKLITIKKNASNEIIEAWEIQDRIKPPVSLYKIEKREYETVNISEVYVIISGQQFSTGVSFGMKIYDFLSGQLLHTYDKKQKIKLGCFNTNKYVICFIQDNEIIVENYLSSEVLITFTSEDNLDIANSIDLFTHEERNDFFLSVDYPDFIKFFHVDGINKKIISAKKLLKQTVSALHSIFFDFERQKLVAGSRDGNIYMWNYQDESPVYMIPMDFEYDGMKIDQSENIDIDTFKFLKHNHAQGLPRMNNVMIVKAALDLGLIMLASETSKKYFAELKSLFSKHFEPKSIFFTYLNTLEFSTHKGLQINSIENLDIGIENTNWDDYPEIMNYFKTFLKDF
jgi:predicted NACHT family NTPase/WD40 repeat protein